MLMVPGCVVLTLLITLGPVPGIVPGCDTMLGACETDVIVDDGTLKALSIGWPTLVAGELTFLYVCPTGTGLGIIGLAAAGLGCCAILVFDAICGLISTISSFCCPGLGGLSCNWYPLNCTKCLESVVKFFMDEIDTSPAPMSNNFNKAGILRGDITEK